MRQVTIYRKQEKNSAKNRTDGHSRHLGPVPENGFSENSELIDSELKETLGFRFHKASSS